MKAVQSENSTDFVNLKVLEMAGDIPTSNKTTFIKIQQNHKLVRIALNTSFKISLNVAPLMIHRNGVFL